MGLQERDYIARCKQLITEKFRLETDNGSLRQRDLEYLADRIEESSGIKLSLSTLKRIWKKDYDQVPHLSTLQALVAVLGFESWQAFKSQEQAVTQVITHPVVQRKRKPSHILLLIGSMVILIPVCLLIALRSRKPDPVKPVINGPVLFTGSKTVATGVPNTVIFNYDVSQVQADSFFFQQSWNDRERARIEADKKYYSTIYYYPGFHRARLMANDSVLKRFKVHIQTDGWLPLVRGRYTDSIPVYLKRNSYVKNGQLHVSTQDLITSRIDTGKSFVLSYFNVREFSGVHSDNFFLDTRVKLDSPFKDACSDIRLVVLCEENIFFVYLTPKGCERNGSVRMGEVFIDAVQHDLSAFGRDLVNWQRIQLEVVNKKASILIDGKPVYQINFKKDFGRVMGLAYHFSGTGSIDYVRLGKNESQLVYNEQF